MFAISLAGVAQMPTVIGPAAHIQPPPATYHFPAGQTWVYRAEWRIWSAGTASLRMETSGGEQRVSGAADSSGFVALLYHVHDRFESFLDPRTFCSQRMTKHTEEGFRRLDTRVQFDYARRKSVLNETNLKSGQRKREEQDIPGCVTDALSGMYYVGSLPLQVGNAYVFPVNDGGKTVEVNAKVEAREQVITEAGTFWTLRVATEASAGPLKDRGKIWIWYTDDAQHTPVQMRSRLFWGTLSFKLQRIENK